MLSSLLSLYITSTISLTEENSVNPPEPDTQSIKIASLDFPAMIENNKIPVKDPVYISPIIEAKSAIAIDLNTGTILFEKNSHDRVSIASITKLMTMMIILKENDLNEVATVSYNSAITEGSTMYLREGEKIAIENLIYGAIINSANDSAVALAEHNAGSTAEFVKKMNKKAKELGLINTHYSNPIGLDNPENFSSAYDVAKLGKYIYQYDFIKHAAKIKNLTVWSSDKKYSHKLTSTNELLDNEYYHVKGLKTGRTESAGLCLIAVSENDDGDEIITVVLDSPDRFEETKILTDWVFRAYKW